MKDKVVWESLKPSRVVDVWLYNKPKNGPGKVYILDAYAISPEVSTRYKHSGRCFYGLLIRSYGLRNAKMLNNSFDIVDIPAEFRNGRPGTYVEITAVRSEIIPWVIIFCKSP